MNFKDRLVTDKTGKQFVFTVEMQRKLQEAGFTNRTGISSRS